LIDVNMTSMRSDEVNMCGLAWTVPLICAGGRRAATAIHLVHHGGSAVVHGLLADGHLADLLTNLVTFWHDAFF